MIVLPYDDQLANEALVRDIERGNFDVARAMLEDGRSITFRFKYGKKLKRDSLLHQKCIPEKYWVEHIARKFLDKKIEPHNRGKMKCAWNLEITELDSLKKECTIKLRPVHSCADLVR
jgi:hypothetical protein